jgi:hypothetical protein
MCIDLLIYFYFFMIDCGGVVFIYNLSILQSIHLMGK